MRLLTRLGVALLLAAGLNAGAAWRVSAQGLDEALRHRVEHRFQVLPVRGGIVLTPRHASAVKSIEIRDGVIAINGDPATGAELREKLGADAPLVLEVSYLAPEALAHWGQTPARTSAPSGTPAGSTASPSAVPAPEAPDASDVQSPDAQAPPPIPPPPDVERRDHRRHSASRVHIGGDITVNEDEIVTDPVVAVGGSITILGRTEDDVVAILGGVHLGPKAVVKGAITTVGGHVEREPGSVIEGEVNEIRFGPPHFALHAPVFAGLGPGWEAVHGWMRLVGTLLRIGVLVLLSIIVTLVAARPVSRIGDRAAREPWLSGFAGLLAQLLFIPVLVLTIVVLAITIIGIPLLILVPFGVVGFLLAMLIGFAAVSLRIGRWAVGVDRPAPVAMAVGVILVAAVALLTRALALLPLPLWPITWPLAITGFFIEYVVWTVGLGAALLTRFGSRGGPYEVVMPPPLPSYEGPSTV